MKRQSISSRRAGAIAVLGSILLAGATTAGPLDSEDAAKVAEIDATVDDQLDAIGDARSGMDDLVEAAEFAQEEVGALIGLNDAQLVMDIERQLLASCAGDCAAMAPRAPAAPTTASSAACFTCTNPRFIITNEHGGYLEDVLGLVEGNIQAVEIAGLDLDVDTARALMAEAQVSLAGGRVEAAFAASCEAFATLACQTAAPTPGAPAAARTPRAQPTNGFAGAPRRR